MKALIQDRYGQPEVLKISEIEAPEVAENSVLVRVRAASLNAGDWYAMAGRPYIGRMATGLRRPKSNRVGADFAGTVAAVGASVTRFKPGDEVYGMRNGALAEYVTVSESKLAPKPENMSFVEAAAVPIAALTALQALRNKGRVQPGQKVLINGASGGVGTFAVQIAKALGAEVTAVCRTRNVEMVKALGADHVIDYTQEDFTRSATRFDLMVDNVGSQPFRKYRRILTREATVVIVGGPKKNRPLGPLAYVLKSTVAAIGKPQKVTFFIAKNDVDDLLWLKGLIEEGKVRAVVEQRYDLTEAAEAFRYLGEGHTRAKLVIGL